MLLVIGEFLCRCRNTTMLLKNLWHQPRSPLEQHSMSAGYSATWKTAPPHPPHPPPPWENKEIPSDFFFQVLKCVESHTVVLLLQHFLMYHFVKHLTLISSFMFKNVHVTHHDSVWVIVWTKIKIIVHVISLCFCAMDKKADSDPNNPTPVVCSLWLQNYKNKTGSRSFSFNESRCKTQLYTCACLWEL